MQTLFSGYSFGARLTLLVQRKPFVFLPIWLGAFFLAIWPAAVRLLWYDELLTYYGATAPNLTRFWAGITHFDFNPPLEYALVRMSLWIFGDTPFAVRLPSILAFIGATLILFWFTRVRSGGGFALITVGLLWSTGFLAFATQARPYALELLFGSLAFVAWTDAVSRQRWSAAHSLLCVAVAGLILSHCFAPIFLLPLVCGESVRTWDGRQKDRRIWMALLLPVPLLAFYISFLLKPGTVLFPLSSIATLATIGQFYKHICLSMLIPLALGVVAAVLLAPPRCPVTMHSLVPRHEWVCLLVGLVAPSVLVLYAMHGKMAWTDRYGILAAVPVTLLSELLLERLAKRSPTAALLGACLILVQFGAAYIVWGRPAAPQAAVALPPELPIVVANGGRFLELDHYESAEVVSRLYYLTDQAAATHAHSTIFEEFGELKQAYPVRARVMRYETFVDRHKHFLVVSVAGDSSQDWLMPKLKAQGARIAPVVGYSWLLDVKVNG